MKNIIFLIVLCCSTLCMAQNAIKGNVKSEDNSPLQGCTVLFLQKGEITGGTITDKKGNFELKDVPSGDYICKISMIGFKAIEYPFKLSNNIHLPRFVMKEDATLLDEVKVTRDRRNMTQEKAGMTTYFLSEHAKKASDTFEALREVPRLVINSSERSIKLDDGRSPLILVNGVKRPISSLDPELLESIDVIDNPSARYMEDESTQAILNVRVKRKGIKPYLNGNAYTRYTPNFSFGISGFSTQLGTENYTLYATGDYHYFNNDNAETFSDSYSGNIHRAQNGTRRYDANSYYLNVGGDYVFSDKNYTAFSLKYISNPSDNDSKAKGNIEDLSTGDRSDQSVTNLISNKYKTLAGDLYYKHTFKPNQTLDFEGNYTYTFSGSEGKQDELNELYSYHSRINLDNSRHFGKLNINYSNLINEKYMLEMGSRTNYAETSIDDLQDEWEVYKHKKWQEYLYVGLDNNRSENKFNYVFSVGVDMTFTNADKEKNKYIDILPSVSISYKLSKGNTISLQYNRNRSTPDAGYMNPRNTSTDSLYIYQGNPYLTPSYTDKVRFGYVLNYKKLRFNPYIEYTYFSDYITNYGEMNENIYINTYKNMGYKNRLQIGGTFNYNLPFGNISANVWYQKDYIDNMPFSGDSWQATLNGYFYYKKVSLSMYLGYTTYSYSLTTKEKQIPYTNFTFNWKLPKNWSLSVSGEGVLCPEVPSKTWVVNGDYRSYSTFLMKDRYPKFMIGLSYSFKNKIKMKWRNTKRFYEVDNGLENVKVQ